MHLKIESIIIRFTIALLISNHPLFFLSTFLCKTFFCEVNQAWVPRFKMNGITPVAGEDCTLGWALWNRNSFEFKFDDTRLSSKYEYKIGPIKKNCCCVLTLQSQDARKKWANLIFILWGKSGTGTAPLTQVFGPIKNRVKRKPCYRRCILVPKLGNGTFSFPKSPFWANLC